MVRVYNESKNPHNFCTNHDKRISLGATPSGRKSSSLICSADHVVWLSCSGINRDLAQGAPHTRYIKPTYLREGLVEIEHVHMVRHDPTVLRNRRDRLNKRTIL